MHGIVKTVKESATDYRFVLSNDNSKQPTTFGDSDKEEIHEFKLVKRDLYLEKRQDQERHASCSELAMHLGCPKTSQDS